MKTKLFTLMGIMALAATALVAMSKNPMVGGQEMFPTKNIFENAVNSADHTTLVAALLKPENQGTLKKVLTYHVVAGRWSAADLKKKIKEGNGTAELSTVEGGKLWATLHMGKHIMLKDEKGSTALITIPDVFQSNGVIHVIDSVVMPN